MVTVAATIPKVTIRTGASGEITLTLSRALAKPVVVSYALKGTATNGADYHVLIGTKKILAGKTKATIQIVPEGNLDGVAEKTVIFYLESGKGYTLGTKGPVKVKIFAKG